MEEELVVVLNRRDDPTAGLGFSLLDKPGFPPVIYDIEENSPAAECGKVSDKSILEYWVAESLEAPYDVISSVPSNFAENWILCPKLLVQIHSNDIISKFEFPDVTVAIKRNVELLWFPAVSLCSESYCKGRWYRLLEWFGNWQRGCILVLVLNRKQYAVTSLMGSWRIHSCSSLDEKSLQLIKIWVQMQISGSWWCIFPYFMVELIKNLSLIIICLSVLYNFTRSRTFNRSIVNIDELIFWLFEDNSPTRLIWFF